MTNQAGFPEMDEDTALEVLSNLLVSPEVFFSVLNETGFGIFKLIEASAVLATGEVLDTPIVNPRGYWTLVLKANVQPSSPIIEFTLIKDLISSVDISGFELFNELVPNFYTPIRNAGIIRITNLSNISTPSFSLYVQTLQIRTDIWTSLRHFMTETLNKTIGLRFSGAR